MFKENLRVKNVIHYNYRIYFFKSRNLPDFTIFFYGKSKINFEVQLNKLENFLFLRLP